MLISKQHPFSPQSLQIYAITIFFYSIVYMILMVLPFYSLSIGATKTEIGLIMGITMFASMVSRPIAGRIIDHYGTNRIFVIAIFVFALSLLGYFLPHLWIFGMVRMIQGIVAAFFSTSMEMITIDLLSKKMRGQGLSLYSLATIIPTTFGPALALWLKDWISIPLLFLLFFIMGVGNCIFALRLSRQIQSQEKPKSRSEKIATGEKTWKNRVFLLSSIIMLLASVANGTIFTFLPLYLESQGSTFSEIYFLIQTLTLAISRFFGRNWISSDGRVPFNVLIATLFLTSLGSLLLGISISPYPLVLAAICNGIAFAFLYPTLLTYVSFSIPEHSRGFLLGLFIGAADLGFALGAIVMGPLADLLPFSVIFGICSTLSLLALGFVYGYRKTQI